MQNLHSKHTKWFHHGKIKITSLVGGTTTTTTTKTTTVTIYRTGCRGSKTWLSSSKFLNNPTLQCHAHATLL